MRKIPATIRTLLEQEDFVFEDGIVNLLVFRLGPRELPAPSWKSLHGDVDCYWIALKPDSKWLDWEFDLNECCLTGGPPLFVGVHAERVYGLPDFESAKRAEDTAKELHDDS